jgi:hypothetical protein
MAAQSLFLPTGDHFTLAGHHRLDTSLRRHARFVLLMLHELGVQHIDEVEETVSVAPAGAMSP